MKARPFESMDRAFKDELQKMGIWAQLGQAALTAAPAVISAVSGAKKKPTPKPPKPPGMP